VTFLRFLGAAFFLVTAVGLYALFEYWKLFDPNNRYIFAGFGAGFSLFFSVILFESLGEMSVGKSIQGAIMVTLLLWAGLFTLLTLHSRTPLNRILNTGTRCESLLLPLVEFRFDVYRAYFEAQDRCRLRMFLGTLKTLSLVEGEDRIVQVAKYLQSESRLNETELVLLMANYSQIQEKRFLGESGASPMSTLQNLFAVMEAEVSLIAVYNVKSLEEEDLEPNSEAQKLRKIVELSTLGKTLHLVVAKVEDTLKRYEEMSSEATSRPLVYGPELSLLEIRAKKLRSAVNGVIKRWGLRNKLESLHVLETYPQQAERLLADVSFEPI
jgi:hypothetical protein